MTGENIDFAGADPARRGPDGLVILTDADFADLIGLAEEVWRGQPGRVLAALIQSLGEEGLRLGEALALRPCDLDFHRNRLRVCHSLDRVNGARRPNPRGTRDIHLFAETKRRLLEVTEDAADVVFQNSVGGPLARHGLRKRWSAVAATWEATRPDDHWVHARLRRDSAAHLTPHELRRRAAGWLLRPPPEGAGLSPLEVAHHLGASPSLIQRIPPRGTGTVSH